MTTDILGLSLTELAHSIRQGTLTSEQIVSASLQRIAELDPVVRAWAHLDPDRALDQARRCDAESPRGPLHGIPVGVKDVIDTFDMPTRRGTPIYRDRRPTVDAACVDRLRERGAVILGKTTTTEFATWTPSDTTNPHNPRHTPGGSSSGSAAAVGAGMVPLALGTQTVGSTIRPASFCGVVGMKPTFGFLPLAGISLTSQRLDTLGLFARTASDIGILYQQLSPGETAQPATPLTGVTVVQTPWWDKVEPLARLALATAEEAFRGVTSVRREEFPESFAEITRLHLLVAHYDIANNLRHEYVRNADLLSDNLRPRIEEGLAIGSAAYGSALREIDVIRSELQPAFRNGAVIVMPAATGVAPEGLSWTGDTTFAQPWSMLGNPALTVPVVTDDVTGLPVGVQLVAERGCDDLLIAAAELLTAALAGGRATPAAL